VALALVHTTDSTTADGDPALSTLKLNDFMGLNQGVEQRCWNLVNMAVSIPNRNQLSESENSHAWPPINLHTPVYMETYAINFTIPMSRNRSFAINVIKL
jgi:hypothetical protein